MCQLQPCGLEPARLLHPWDFPGKNTGVGCCSLHQGIFLTQGLNPGLLHCRHSHQGSPRNHRRPLKKATQSDLHFYKFICFNWRLITSQYCIGFAIHQHESATGVHEFLILNPLPPPSPYHPSGSSQCTSPEHPVSCIKPGLAIRFTYDIIHVSVPFSQSIPLLPSPTESKRLFYTSVLQYKI